MQMGVPQSLFFDCTTNLQLYFDSMLLILTESTISEQWITGIYYAILFRCLCVVVLDDPG